jgi:hypothetical protein
MSSFNILVLIEAGEIKEDKGPLAIIQNIETEHAHAICKWLVLATGQPAWVRLMGFEGAQEIKYTPEQLKPR